MFQSLKRDVAFFYCPSNMGSSMAYTSFHSHKRDVAFFHAQEQPCCRETHAGFNRSSAMWPSSTGSYAIPYGGSAMFQSLKRDVAFFHRSPHQGQHRRADVSF